MQNIKTLLEIRLVKHLIYILVITGAINVTIDNFFSEVHQNWKEGIKFVDKADSASEKLESASIKTSKAAKDIKGVVKEVKTMQKPLLEEASVLNENLSKIQDSGVKVNVKTDLAESVSRIEPIAKHLTDTLSPRNMEEISKVLASSVSKANNDFEKTANTVTQNAKKELTSINFNTTATVEIKDNHVSTQTSEQNPYNYGDVGESISQIENAIKNK